MPAFFAEDRREEIRSAVCDFVDQLEIQSAYDEVQRAHNCHDTVQVAQGIFDATQAVHGGETCGRMTILDAECLANSTV